MSATIISTTPIARQRVRGKLNLLFEYDKETNQTRMRVQAQHPPLKVIRAFPIADGGSLVHLHNISGGILGGDHLELEVRIQEGATAQLTTTGATRVYRTPAGATAAHQINRIDVAKNGLIEYLPDQLIPFAGARYQQETVISLEEQAGLFWWETLAPGRIGSGELFQYQSLRIHLTIRGPEIPLAIENMHLEPQKKSPRSHARLGAYHYYSSFYICKVGLPANQWQDLETELDTLAQKLTQIGLVEWGVSRMVAHGLVIKALSKTSTDTIQGLYSFWREAKQFLYQKDAQRPRKIY